MTEQSCAPAAAVCAPALQGSKSDQTQQWIYLCLSYMQLTSYGKRNWWDAQLGGPVLQLRLE